MLDDSGHLSPYISDKKAVVTNYDYYLLSCILRFYVAFYIKFAFLSDHIKILRIYQLLNLYLIFFFQISQHT